MHWADPSRDGRYYSKDPAVVQFQGQYLLYYSMPPSTNKSLPMGWAIGIARSMDLVDWQKTGEMLGTEPYEFKGLCAADSIVLGDRVHLFYQTYGNGRDDAICHAVSDDGLRFRRDPSNPVFKPTGKWNSGRAIDADVFPVGDRLFLWYATRDPEMKVQMLGVASAPLASDFGRASWRQLGDGPILEPMLPWEKQCIEAPSVMRRGDTLVMFYAGGYNNDPQQIGIATSRDGLAWTRLMTEPLVGNGRPGTWNSSESGHPGVFEDKDGRTYLFYQGNADRGKSWYLSCMELEWDGLRPKINLNSKKFPVRR
jgi:predicted GH43/DUF377 family glycosyl hydrolase